MEKQYKIGDIVYILKDFTIFECTIMGVSLEEDNSYKYSLEYNDEKLRGNWFPENIQIFSTYKEAELLQMELQLLIKFSIGDLVICKSKDNSVWKIGNYRVNYEKKIITYDLIYLDDEEGSWHSGHANIPVKDLVRINREYIPAIVEYKALVKKIDNLETEHRKLITDLKNLNNQTLRDLKIKFQDYSSYFEKLKDSKRYQLAKSIFEEK